MPLKLQQTQKNIKLYYYHVEEEEQEGNQECATGLGGAQQGSKRSQRGH
jgi:hypothetical protein